jgi:hypothetical protein
MKFEFNKSAEPICSSDPLYDLIWGGYIEPSEILINSDEIDKVSDAAEVLREFLKQAEESGKLELM